MLFGSSIKRTLAQKHSISALTGSRTVQAQITASASASRKIITYRTKKCKRQSVKWIKSQSRVRVSRIYIGKGYTSYYVKGRGWYKVKNDVFKAEKLFSGVYYVG